MDEHAEREREEREERPPSPRFACPPPPPPSPRFACPPPPPPSPRTPLPDEGGAAGAAEGGSKRQKVEEPDDDDAVTVKVEGKVEGKVEEKDDAAEGIEAWSTGVEQPDALPPLRRRFKADGRLLAAHDFLNRYDMSRVEGYTPESGHLLKAKFFLSFAWPEEPPYELCSSRHSGLRGADELWHKFIETPQYAAEFGPALGYAGGPPHTQGVASLEDVVELEDRLARAYRRAFRKRLTIPEPEVPLPDEYAELLEEDEVVCG